MQGGSWRTRRAPALALTALLVFAVLVAPACAADERESNRPAGDAAQTVPRPREPSPPASAPPEVAGFVAFGDFGGGPAQHAVADAMERWAVDHRVDALVTTGDNVYDRGEPWHFQAQLDEPYRELRADRPMWVTLGNHDVIDGHGDEQLAHLGLPALPYARRLPGVQLLFLDGNRPSAQQARWLEERLMLPGPRVRVVVLHQPAYSCSEHGPTPSVLQTWVPIFERYRVDLVLAGHDHNYQRFVSGNGVNYVVSGGGGRVLYAVGQECELAVRRIAAARRHHFVGIEVTDGVVTLTAVAAEGEVIDRHRFAG